MLTEITVRVTREHITKGCTLEPGNCPVWHAMRPYIKDAALLNVYQSCCEYGHYDARPLTVGHNAKAESWIKAYDRDPDKATPATLTFRVPDWALAEHIIEADRLAASAMRDAPAMDYATTTTSRRQRAQPTTSPDISTTEDSPSTAIAE